MPGRARINTMNGEPSTGMNETRVVGSGERKMRPKKEGLGKDIRAWKLRKLYKLHPMEQRPVNNGIKIVKISENRRVRIRRLNGKIYLNLKDLFPHYGKKDLSLKRWECLKKASPKIDAAIEILKRNIKSP